MVKSKISGNKRKGIAISPFFTELVLDFLNQISAAIPTGWTTGSLWFKIKIFLYTL